MDEKAVRDEVEAILSAAVPPNMPDGTEDLRAALALLRPGMPDALHRWLLSATAAEQRWFAHLIATYGRERLRLRPQTPESMTKIPKLLWFQCCVLEAALPAFRASPVGQRWPPRAITAFVYLIISGLEDRFRRSEWALDANRNVLRYARGYALYIVAGRNRTENTVATREWFVEHYEQALPLLPVIMKEEFCSPEWLEALIADAPERTGTRPTS